MRSEPVILLAFVEHYLQGSNAYGQQADADVIKSRNSSCGALRPGRVLDQPENEEERQDAHGQINEEDPAPRVVVGDPPAKGRSNRRRNHGRDPKNSERQAALLRRECVCQNGLGHGLQSAPASTLEHSKENDRPKTWSESAQQRAQGEECQTDHKETLAAQDTGKPSAEGQHDGI